MYDSNDSYRQEERPQRKQNSSLTLPSSTLIPANLGRTSLGPSNNMPEPGPALIF